MDRGLLSAKKRGNYYVLKYDDKPIEISFKKCSVVRPMYDAYIRLDISNAEGNKDDLLKIHEFIKDHSKSEFSPLKYAAENGSWKDIVCKISGADWEPCQKYIDSGTEVDVTFAVKSFGKHGWFLHVKNIYL